MKKKLISFFGLLLLIISTSELCAKRTSFGSSKKNTPKPAYAGFGKPSKVNGKIKTKTTHGYFKPSNGYKYVNPYSRSK